MRHFQEDQDHELRLGLLPDELLLVILTLLDFRMLAAASQLNSYFLKITQTVWEKTFAQHFPQNYPRLVKLKEINWCEELGKLYAEETRLYKAKANFFYWMRINEIDKVILELREYNDLYLVDKNGLTLIAWARRKKWQLVLDHCFKVASKYYLCGNQLDLKRKDFYENTLLHWSIHCNQSIAIVKTLIHPENVNLTESQWGYTALHLAALYGNSELATLLIEQGACPKIMSTFLGLPLHIAIANRSAKVVEVLVNLPKCGINKNRRQDRISPLFLATLQGDELTALTLLDHGAKSREKLFSGYTMLHIAARNGLVRVANALIERGAQVNAYCNEYGVTPLHGATTRGQHQMVRLLLRKGAYVNAEMINGPSAPPTRIGATALYLAAENGFYEIVLELIRQGANIDTSTIYGASPILAAALGKHLCVVVLLLKLGAELSMLQQVPSALAFVLLHAKEEYIFCSKSKNEICFGLNLSFFNCQNSSEDKNAHHVTLRLV